MQYTYILYVYFIHIQLFHIHIQTDTLRGKHGIKLIPTRSSSTLVYNFLTTIFSQTYINSKSIWLHKHDQTPKNQQLEKKTKILEYIDRCGIRPRTVYAYKVYLYTYSVQCTRTVYIYIIFSIIYTLYMCLRLFLTPAFPTLLPDTLNIQVHLSKYLVCLCSTIYQGGIWTAYRYPSDRYFCINKPNVFDKYIDLNIQCIRKKCWISGCWILYKLRRRYMNNIKDGCSQYYWKNKLLILYRFLQ